MMWKEKYRVGAELVDTQHRELFHRVSNFIQAVQSPQPWENKLEHVKETMAFMQDYVIIHFNDEERFQAEIGYPELERHKEIHARFRAGVRDMPSGLHTRALLRSSSKNLAAGLWHG